MKVRQDGYLLRISSLIGINEKARSATAWFQ